MSAPALPSLLFRAWQPEPGVIVAILLLGVLYLAGTRRSRRPWPVGRTLSFGAGLLALLVALDSGIGTYDDSLLSDHMVQHLLLIDVVPILLLGGRPLLLALRSLPPLPRRRLGRTVVAARWLTEPATCLVIYYAVIFTLHAPPVFNATLRYPLLHAGEHGLFLVAGLFLWWPLHGGEGMPGRQLDGLGRLVYLLVAMLPMAVIGAYLNRDPSLAYLPYAGPARALHVSAVADQQLGGAIMWVAGSVVMAGVGLWSAMRALILEERRLKASEARA